MKITEFVKCSCNDTTFTSANNASKGLVLCLYLSIFINYDDEYGHTG